MQLTTQQTAALEQLKDFVTGRPGGLMTLEGYAGTGKTTLVARLLGEDLGRIRIAVAAPTNKAVGVLEAKIKAAGATAHSFSSLHSLLGLQLVEREDGQHECRPGTNGATLHEYHLVIVDESSMIGPDLFGKTVMAMRGFSRVLFVGDPAQLPPVDPQGKGEISPTFLRVVNKAVLTQVVRQAADNPIIALSMRIRSAIEAGQRMGSTELLAACPGNDRPTTVGVMHGGDAAVYNVALAELRAGVDCRIVAYTNQQVQSYNSQLHQALHGADAPLFAPGERVVVHEACEVRSYEAAKLGWISASRVSLHTSEELVVVSAKPDQHPYYPEILANLLELDRDDGSKVYAFIAVQADQFQRRVSEAFDRVREIKLQQANGVRGESVKDAIAKAWMLKKSFAPLRHVYAITAHKSQGSTINTVIVDLANLGRMRDVFDYNRALYVAATRAAQHLALVA